MQDLSGIGKILNLKYNNYVNEGLIAIISLQAVQTLYKIKNNVPLASYSMTIGTLF